MRQTARQHESGMTPGQIALARRLRSNIMAISKTQHPWNQFDIHDLMSDWGFGSSLRALGIDELHELKELLSGQYKPHYTPFMRKSMDYAKATNTGVKASYRQVCYICILYGGYCWYRRIRRKQWDEKFQGWLKKYGHADFAGFCSPADANKIINMLESEIWTTFGDFVFTQITGKQYQGKK